MSDVKRYDLGDHNGKIVLVQRPEGQVVQAEEHLNEVAKLNGWLDLTDQALRCLEEGDTGETHRFLSRICEGRMDNGWDPFSQPLRLRGILKILDDALANLDRPRPFVKFSPDEMRELHRLARGPL